jgi:anion-transporting  ArsA/GET3 family ATPase
MGIRGKDAAALLVAGLSRWRPLFKKVFASPALQAFCDAAPGVVELSSLAAIVRMHDERQGKGGARSWDPIVVDMDATGHALMFFRMPEMLMRFVPQGPLRRPLEAMAALLADSSRSCVHLVTLPADLVVEETHELCKGVRQENLVSLGALVVNRVPPAPLRVDVAALEQVRGMAVGEQVEETLALAHQALLAHEARRRVVDTLPEALGLVTVELEEAPGEPSAAWLHTLAEATSQRWGRKP